MQRWSRSLWIAGVLSVGACGDETPVEPPPDMPEVSAPVITLNEHNNMSTVVDFETTHVDSARVVCTSATHVEMTPYFPVQDGFNRIVTLGLLPNTDYTHVVEASGTLGDVSSAPVDFATGPLPDFLLNSVRLETTFAARRDTLRAGNAETPTRWTLINLRGDPYFTIAFDDSGRIRWYRQFDLLGAFSTQLPNGNFAAFVGTTTGFTPSYGYYTEFAPDGRMVDRHQAPAPLYTDNHELLMSSTSGGGWDRHLISYDLRRTDTTRIGGVPDAQIAGHQILRIDSQGMVVFMWNAWDHYDLEDWVDGPLNLRQRPLVDFDHPNSLEIDTDGHYLVSIRNFGQIAKIHSGTGEVLWKLGGRLNEFSFVNDTFGSFSAQHSARVTAPGRVLLFDNGTLHSPQVSRAVEYAVDPTLGTATLVWEYVHQPPLYSAFLGSVQRLRNGYTLIGWGTKGIATEVSPGGKVVWEVDVRVNGLPLGVYRFVRIASLYHYERP